MFQVETKLLCDRYTYYCVEIRRFLFQAGVYRYIKKFTTLSCHDIYAPRILSKESGLFNVSLTG